LADRFFDVELFFAAELFDFELLELLDDALRLPELDFFALAFDLLRALELRADREDRAELLP
jgi:hypothetical protein